MSFGVHVIVVALAEGYLCTVAFYCEHKNFCHFLMTDEVSVPVNRVFAVFNTAALFCFVLFW